MVPMGQGVVGEVVVRVIVVTLCLLLFGCTTGRQGGYTTPSQIVKVLTINLCADWTSSREERAESLARYIKDNGVDIICFQEGVKGLGQFDPAKHIASRLNYSYQQVPAFGVAGVKEFCVGVISAYPIDSVHRPGCQVEGGDPIDKMPFPGSSRGLLVKTGSIWVMSSHLTVPVEQSKKEAQVQCLQAAMPTGVSIWAGDFNFYRDDPAYKFIRLQEAVYAGVPEVDMIFFSGLSLLESKLVFEDHFISDHKGVLATFRR